MQDFITAIGLLLVFEGLLYGGFPALAKRMAKDVTQTSDNALRTAGMIALLLGVGLVWLIRG